MLYQYDITSPPTALSEFQDKAMEALETLRAHVTKSMPSKGDKESECQRLCILNKISELEHCINGTEEEDVHRWPEEAPQVKRGSLTPEVQEIATRYLGREITVRELRIVGYIHYCCVNGQSASNTNEEEQEILERYDDMGLIQYRRLSGAIQVYEKFWNYMNAVMREAYANLR